jgi:hypothetical protein
VWQTPGRYNLDRKDHVWLQAGGRWKCVLCGAICAGPPPEYPTRFNWQPSGYEPLTAEERGQAPFRRGA